jgi:hypothetical protein
VSKNISFPRVLVAIFCLTFVAGFAVVVLSGTTDEGTTSAIHAERLAILKAEKVRCRQYGSYASTKTLRREGLLPFKPMYNSVVYLAGAHCGTIIIGSPSYQSPSN